MRADHSLQLYGLAEDGYAPRMLLRVNKLGCPYYCLFVTWLFNALAFLRVSSSGSTVFGWFVNLVSLFGGLTWMSISFCHIRFVNGMKYQEARQNEEGVPKDPTRVLRRADLRFKSPFGVIGSWVAFIVTGVVCFFKGMRKTEVTTRPEPLLTVCIYRLIKASILSCLHSTLLAS